MMSKNSKDMLDAILVDRGPEQVNLFPRIAGKLGGSVTFRRRTKPVYLVVLVLVVIAMLIASLPYAVSAMRRLFRFIPGIGLVEQDGGFRILAQPGRVERDGVSVTVEQGTVDAQRTVLLVRVDFTADRGDPVDCSSHGSDQIRLPDGVLLASGELSGRIEEKSYTQRMIFPAIPAEDDRVVLEMPCLMPIMPGKWPENWQIPLHFIPGDPARLAPVIELPPATPTPTGTFTVMTQPASRTVTATAVTATPSNPATLTPAQPPAPPYGITMTLEKWVKLPDGYMLLGSMHWTDPAIPDYGVVPVNVKIVDAAGQIVLFDELPPDSFPPPGSQAYAWSYKMHGTQIDWPVTLTASADVDLNTGASFPLDLGANLQPGQTWSPAIDVPAGDHVLHVLSVAASADPNGNGMLKFTLQSDPAVIRVSLYDPDHPLQGGGGGGDSTPNQGPFTSEFAYTGPLPAGTVTIRVDRLTVLFVDMWKITWQP